MFSQAKCSLLSVLSYSIVFIIVLLVRSAPAQDAASPALKSQIVRWDEAKSHTADWGEMRRYFQGQTFATEKTFVAVAVIQPGKSVHQAHRHAEEEYLVVVDGIGTWWLDGKESPAKRGDILYVEPWVYHGLTNTGDKPLVFLVVKYNGKGVQPPARPDDRPDELAVQPGDGQSENPPMEKVSGLITLDGMPVANANVSFVPEKGGCAAAGVTDENGRFVLTDGAVPGQYRVTITSPAATTPKKADEARPAVPAKYGDKSGLAVEVVKGKNELQFDLID